MKTKQLFVALALIAAGTSAFAEQAGKTRAEVQAELAQARTNHTYSVGGSEYVDFATQATPSTKTRAEVQAELKQARTDNTLAVRDTEYPATVTTTASRSRSEVRDEAIQAAKNTVKSTDYNFGG